MTEIEFNQLSKQGFNRIPLMLEAFADLETPLSLYLKLAFHQDGGKHSFLLESVVGGERFGRYSFIGLPARTLLRANGFGEAAHTEVVTDGFVVETDLGEYILQLRHETPSHVVMPAIHLKKEQIADTFREHHTMLDPGRPLEAPGDMTEEARTRLR